MESGVGRQETMMAIHAAVRRAKINFSLWAETLSPGDVVDEISGLSVEDVHLLAALLDISLEVPQALATQSMEPALHSVTDTGSQYEATPVGESDEEDLETDAQACSQSL